MLKRLLFILPLAGLLLFLEYQLRAQSETHSTLDLAPTGLRVDLLEHTDRVWQGGRLINTALSEAVLKAGTYQFANILSKKPLFSWELRSRENEVLQTACQVRVASSPSLLGEEKPDLWDSGKLENNNELSLTYSGKELSPVRSITGRCDPGIIISPANGPNLRRSEWETSLQANMRRRATPFKKPMNSLQ